MLHTIGIIRTEAAAGGRRYCRNACYPKRLEPQPGEHRDPQAGGWGGSHLWHFRVPCVPGIANCVIVPKLVCSAVSPVLLTRGISEATMPTVSGHSFDSRERLARMNIEAFLLCDAATESTGGKLNVLGAFDQLLTAQCPVVHPACAIVARIRFSLSEAGHHSFKISFVDEDGRSIIPPATGEGTFGLSQGALSGAYNMILNIHKLSIEDFGDYSLDLTIDDAAAASLPLSVKPL